MFFRKTAVLARSGRKPVLGLPCVANNPMMNNSPYGPGARAFSKTKYLTTLFFIRVAFYWSSCYFSCLMKTLYFDCSSGICGDMVLSAFIDLGVPVESINKAIARLNLPGKPKLMVQKKMVHHLSGSFATVKFPQNSKGKARGYSEIVKIIQKSKLNSYEKEKSILMFTLIGKAESKIHNLPLEKVHFHEIGAVDSIADIVGAAYCFSLFDPCGIYFSKIPLGGGVIKSGHGMLPLPAPAASLILKDTPVYGVDVDEELVTPTGAAIIKAFAGGFQEFPSMKLEKVGTGIGKRRFEKLPGILRIFLGKSDEVFEEDRVIVIEANIDNFNPEFYGYVSKLLFEKGAIDVTITPTIMKKGRPGNILSVLSEPKNFNCISNVILAETSTIGLRYCEARRKKLKREELKVKTPFGTIRCKKIFYGEETSLYPEYEDLKRIAQNKKISLNKLNRDVISFLNSNSGKRSRI